jgi:hypothetical protein
MPKVDEIIKSHRAFDEAKRNAEFVSGLYNTGHAVAEVNEYGNLRINDNTIAKETIPKFIAWLKEMYE